ncbi:hypothetical protein [Arcticibacterium luteifluviistationis]|uniref:Outer membrane lipoprotein-sorting protein n=1 Tax=Arcticibacterium luteifluviistationis TaxID=1784714 RepID=A0A2Z4GGX5_9BACT|nr:hypothetical protein [Arcticibacterium luteifluviistationis]AWW00640.1 hypothetical protein DJ013_21615 [Arcticibacterium luteifluviistationis]
MKKQALIILGFITMSFGAFAQTADAIFDNYVKATGGEEVYNSIEAFSIHQAEEDAKVPYESNLAVSVKNNKVLRSRTVLSRNFLYELNGNNANLHVPTGGLNRGNSFQTQKLSDFEKSKLQVELNDKYLPFMNYKAKGYRAKLVGPKNIGGENTMQVELSNSDVTRNYYFSTKTNLIVQEDLTYSNGDKITYKHTAYDKLENGLRYPSESVMTEQGKTRTVKTDIKINNVPEDEFEVK